MRLVATAELFGACHDGHCAWIVMNGSESFA